MSFRDISSETARKLQNWKQPSRLLPRQWCKEKRMAGEKAADAAPGRCRIKGNISRNGKRIHHLPSGRYYAATKINRSRSERWFCSEAEAKAAGWRRSSQ
jgi:hypothetical protein